MPPLAQMMRAPPMVAVNSPPPLNTSLLRSMKTGRLAVVLSACMALDERLKPSRATQSASPRQSLLGQVTTLPPSWASTAARVSPTSNGTETT